MAYVMILFPLLMAVLAAVLPSNRLRPWLLPLSAVVHSALTGFVMFHPELMVTSGWLALDPPGRIVLLAVGTLFLCCSFYSVGYLQYRQEISNRIFCACLLGFLGIMSVIVWSQNLGLMWVAIEATTLVTAPLIYFNRTQRSIEATWKYLLVGSVGIALALLGTFFLAYAALQAGLETTLNLDNMLTNAPLMSKPWLHAACILLLLVFIGMGATVLKVVQGRPSPHAAETPYRDSFLTVSPIILLLGLVLLIGLYLPAPLLALLKEAAAYLEGHP